MFSFLINASREIKDQEKMGSVLRRYHGSLGRSSISDNQEVFPRRCGWTTIVKDGELKPKRQIL